MTPLILITLTGVFIFVAVLAGSITSLVLSRNTAERRRLSEVTGRGTFAARPDIVTVSSRPATDTWASLGKLLPKSPKELNKLGLRLARGGIRHPAGPVVFSLLEIILPLAFGGSAAFFLQGQYRWFAVVIAAVIGFFGPTLLLDWATKKRQREIENGLPDALDLLVVCIEAGSGLDQAIMKAADELALAYPLLGEELRIVNTEIRAGKTRIDAFKNLAQRTKVDDIRSLVAMLIQTDRFGTSIGQALRTHAEVSRLKRRQRAEEAARKLGVKLVFPLVLFFFPAFYVVILGPAIIKFVRAFMK